MSRPTIIAALLVSLAALGASAAYADSTTTCRTDSGGHRICVERDRGGAAGTRERCTTTCRVDSGGHQVCREVCR